MPVAVYQVILYQESNKLEALVQVISISKENAEQMVRREFFKNSSWEVLEVKFVRGM